MSRGFVVGLRAGRFLRALAVVAAVAVSPVGTAAADCVEDYGCYAELVEFQPGAALIQGLANFPTTWSGAEPPGAEVVALVNGLEVQRIAITWSQIEHMCCCPREWQGSLSAVPEFTLEPGDRLELRIGDFALCRSPSQADAELEEAPVGGRRRESRSVR